VPPRPFLTAQWSDLVLVTFEAPEDLVRRAIHPCLDPDRWQDRTHVSVVAVTMRNLRVAGWRVPGFTEHPQVNFRTYVRHGAERGVWFLRQLVPSRLIAAVGRLRYREPFAAIRIEQRQSETPGERRVEYRLGPPERGWRIAVAGSAASRPPKPGSADHHVVERYLGYRSDRKGRLTAFRVEHPPWEVRDVRAAACDIDFAALYGVEWKRLQDRQPLSVVYAVGSRVAVSVPRHP
jgi:uncharacterized protein YqjF (DUF2071 family)